MTELERRALMGDREAQEECTRRGIVLPCPFCGSQNIVTSNWGMFRTWCQDCRGKSDDQLTQIDAIREWNTRLAPPVGRCGECKYYTEEAPGVGCCKDKSGKAEYDFCSYFSRKETKKMGMTKTKATYAVTWVFGKDINAVTADLIQRVGKLTEEEDYCLQGGASLAIDNGMFYAMQTLIKEAEENA